MSAGRLREAVLLHDVEEDFYTDSEVKLAMLKPLVACAGLTMCSLSLRLVIAAKGTSLALLYDDLNRPDEAGVELKRADSLVRDSVRAPYPFFHILLRLVKLILAAANPTEIDLGALDELCDMASAHQATVLEHMMLRRKLAMLVFRMFRREHHDRTSVRRLLARLEHQLAATGNIQTLVEVGNDFYSPMIGTPPDEFLSWWQNFDEAYPDHSTWRQRRTRLIQLIGVYNRLDKQIKARECNVAAEQVIKDCRSFWASGRQSQESSYSATAKSRVPGPRLRPRKLKGMFLPDCYFEDYVNSDISFEHPRTGVIIYGTIGSNSMAYSNNAAVRTLHAWMLHDVQTGKLPLEDICKIVNLDTGITDISEATAYVETLNATTLSARLHRDESGPITCEQWEQKLAILEAWLVRTESFPELQQRFMLFNLQFHRCRQPLAPRQQTDEARRGLELLARLGSGLDNDSRDQIGVFKRHFQLLLASSFTMTWIGATDWTENMEQDFEEGCVMLQGALDEQREKIQRQSLPDLVSMEFMERGILYHKLADLQLAKIEAGGGINIAQALLAFRTAELYYRNERASTRIKGGFQAIRRHVKSLEEPHVRMVFSEGIRLQMLNQPDRRAPEIWSWVQAAKSRGIGSLGRFSKTDDRYANAFLSGEDGEGDGFGPKELRIVELATARPVIFVDWYTDTYLGSVGAPLMLIYKSGQQPRILNLDTELDVSDLVKYRAAFIAAMRRSPDDGRRPDLQPESCLQKFEDLVKPLLGVSEPGDTLVFSPCGLLRGLPLHAIEVDGQPLIRRNPIVYTDSLRYLFYAVSARLTGWPDARSPGFSLTSKVFGGTAAGRASVEAVADILETDEYTGPAFQRDAFVGALGGDTSIIHYHGHATNKPDPFAQALQFSDAELTVRDILDLEPAGTGFHATMLGCSSGATAQADSNEPLGLVPALMYAGASSVVSALWDIHDPDAAEFATAFYASFRPPSGSAAPPPSSSATHVVDLARATQHAVLQILDRTDGRPAALKHWGGFVLNGWWILEMPCRGQQGWEDPPIMYAPPPRPPPPAPPGVRLSRWRYKVPTWLSFHTVWPYFG